ncbi:hypothetical protein ILUMI_25599 [Ignelater luminosus]|uniref:Reverse transcriptase domain-containing protein n=1 Tax=Ignelater luminosus TaxID=2038154 RepID=A0A8K0FW69_IGNLU|nr:hypothetical protein ILUMI_25599 [Ignelater luminosus]
MEDRRTNDTEQTAKIGQYQAGFKEGKSAIDNTFALKQIQGKYKKKKIHVQALFLNFKQALDRINRKAIYEKIQYLQLNLVQITLDRCLLNLISSLLFNIVLQVALRKGKIRLENNIFQNSFERVAYTNDLVLLARTREELKYLLEDIQHEVYAVGLEINEEKLKIFNIREKKTRRQAIIEGAHI